MGALVAAALWSHALRPVEDGLSALRFNLLRAPAADKIAVVELDVKSLKAAGVWPWSRERFAKAILNLEAAGATTVGFDVDFSAASSQTSDGVMAAAIESLPGAVILPTFVQPDADAKGGVREVQNRPLKTLAKDALLASVNIPVDQDGRVREYQLGFGEKFDYQPAIASLMAGVPGQPTSSFLIDYSLKPSAIPHLSFEDVYENRFDRSLVRGRNILIGATAVELGDEFATPMSGTINGVYLHAIAFQNIVNGRALQSPPPLLILLLAAGVIFLLRPTRPGATARSLARRHLAVALVSLLSPLLVQAFLPISLPFAPLSLAQLLCLAWAARDELRRRAEVIIQEREAGLLHLAMHQPETGLANRRAILEALQRQLGAESDGRLAVVTVGIDRFQATRGAIGYALASELIRSVAARLAPFAEEGMVAHLSTSVLVMILRAPDEDALRERVGALVTLDPAHAIGRETVDAFFKLGVALADSDATAEAAETLLEHSSLMLDETRIDGEVIRYFDPATYVDPDTNLALMSEMREGLAGGQLELWYQPKMHIAAGEVRGAEALIRWRHPERGYVAPDVFIGVAEETGAIRELTEWTVRRAILDAEALKARGHDLLISVNISGRLLSDPAFCDGLLAQLGGQEHRLCLEITETAVISNPGAAARAIAAFRAADVKISIDDYGVGLSSLSYLKLLDAHELKVDRSLVETVAVNQRDRLILKSTIDLAHGLGMSVVAEGVEDPALYSALAAMGCDIVQGYLISKPLPLERFCAFLGPAEPAQRAAG